MFHVDEERIKAGVARQRDNLAIGSYFDTEGFANLVRSGALLKIVGVICRHNSERAKCVLATENKKLSLVLWALSLCLVEGPLMAVLAYLIRELVSEPVRGPRYSQMTPRSEGAAKKQNAELSGIFLPLLCTRRGGAGGHF